MSRVIVIHETKYEMSTIVFFIWNLLNKNNEECGKRRRRVCMLVLLNTTQHSEFFFDRIWKFQNTNYVHLEKHLSCRLLKTVTLSPSYFLSSFHSIIEFQYINIINFPELNFTSFFIESFIDFHVHKAFIIFDWENPQKYEICHFLFQSKK